MCTGVTTGTAHTQLRGRRLGRPPALRSTALQAQQMQEAARQRLEEEQAAAAAAEAANWEVTKHQREVQALLERSAELRQLKEKLRAAEVNYERMQQKEQRAALAAQERAYAAALEAAMVVQREAEAAREVEEEAARRAAGAQARQALDRQVQERTELQRVAKVRVGLYWAAEDRLVIVAWGSALRCGAFHPV